MKNASPVNPVAGALSVPFDPTCIQPESIHRCAASKRWTRSTRRAQGWNKKATGMSTPVA
jgi:hypothetical protein